MREEPSWTVRRPLPHVDASAALTANKGHNERGNETVTPHRCRSVQRTRLGCACTPRSADETDGFGQRCAGGRDQRRHRLPGRPGGARTHPRRNTPSRARRERRERAAERVFFALRCGERSPRRPREHYGPCCERSREYSLRRREREATHSRQKTHSSPKRKRTTTGATSTSRACLMGRRSRASGWRSRAAAAG